GLAVGASRHGVDPWVLAGAALALQTTRHAIDFTYPAAQRQAVRPLVRPPLEQPGDGLGSGLPGWLLDAPAPAPAPPAAGRPGAGVWARKVVTFPIGERFAVISLTAALTDARVTFVVLLCGGTLALAAGLAGRIVRSVRTRATLAASDTEDPRLLAVCDHGLLVRALAPIGRAVPAPPWALLGAAAAILAVTIAATGATPPDGAVAAATAAVVVLGAAAAGRPQTDRLRWLAPPLLRAIELGGLAWLGAAGGAGTGPAAYALLCAVAFHHYDGIYRRSATVAGAGWDGRLVVAAALVIVGATPAGFWALAGVLCALFGGPAVRSWVVADRAGRTDPYDEQEDEQA
ncbi:MAG: hypothetical protein QOE86_3080, partial [Solirubrobacteraceae bacterium]|nr:hypothetical protein [Solirubrobacteraceae bacterium]